MWRADDQTEVLVNKLRQVLACLDENEFVHGDLRAPNVHVKDEKIYILDFDWAGKEGQAHYPDLLNPTERWPAGAQVGSLITKEHDRFMIDNLCSPGMPA